MDSRPLVIAHRGASGYRPEHTLESYRLAIALGADYVEPDLVVTADGVLVARHENEIGATTDVADHPELAGRRTTRAVDGRSVTGWFAEDLTLAELRTLRARERLPGLRPHNRLYDGLLQVPTFDEIVDLVTEESRRLGRSIGLCPELKHPSHFARRGLGHEGPLLAALRRVGLDSPAAPVLVQSFEPWVLRRLARRSAVPLLQLVDRGRTYADMLTPAGLREVSTYAGALGAHKSLVVPRDPAGRLGRPADLVARAHDAGLAVHAWTLRNENAFLPADLRRGPEAAAFGDAPAEYAAFAAAGVDGVFSDQPDTALAAMSGRLAHAAAVSG